MGGGEITKINIFDENGETSKVTLNDGENKIIAPYGFYMEGSFFNDENPEYITSFDLSHYDTSNVTNMESMFTYCQGLTSLDVSNFDTSNVTNMESMFYFCTNLTSLNVSNFDTSNVTNMTNMFGFLQNIQTLDLSSFDLTNVTSTSQMFIESENLTTIYFGNTMLSNVENPSIMFSGCNKLNYIRCTESLKKFFLDNQDNVNLPYSLREGGGGTWDVNS